MGELLDRPVAFRPEYPPATLRERALDLLFPPTCVQCRRIGRWICQHCWGTIAWTADRRCMGCHAPWPEQFCAKCTESGSSLDSVTTVAEFDGAAREAVHALKYYGRHAIAPMMSRLMAGAVSEAPFDRVASVPLHRQRRRERGYDQAALLARGVAAKLDLYCETDTLERTRRTRPQVTLSREARRRNVEGAFEAGNELEGESVLLIDDVYTTGATMEAAAAAVRRAGAERVCALTFALAGPGVDGPEGVRRDGVGTT